MTEIEELIAAGELAVASGHLQPVWLDALRTAAREIARLDSEADRIAASYANLYATIAEKDAEIERWKLQSDDWQKRGWELGAACDEKDAEIARVRAETLEAAALIAETTDPIGHSGVSWKRRPEEIARLIRALLPTSKTDTSDGE